MKRIFPKYFLFSLFSLCGLLPAMAASPLRGSWIHHAPADLYSSLKVGSHCNVVSIQESEDFVYLMILGHLHMDSESDIYTQSHPYPFYLDKRESTPQIRPLSDLSGIITPHIESMEYCPEGKFLALADSRKRIFIIPEDGSAPLSFEGLGALLPPANLKINSIGFSPDGLQIIVATSIGIAAISSEDASLIGFANLDYNVSHAAFAAGHYILNTSEGVKVNTNTDNAFPRKASDFALLTPANYSSSAQVKNLCLSSSAIRPGVGDCQISPDSFLFVSTSNASAGGIGNSLTIATLDPSDPTRCTLTPVASGTRNANNTGWNAGWYHRNPWEGRYGRTSSGFWISSDASIFILSPDGKGVDFSAANPSQDYADRCLTIIPQDPTPSPAAGKELPVYWKFSTFNGRDFLTFEPRSGFRMRHADIQPDGSARWTWNEVPLPVNSSAAQIARGLDYNPKYGMMCRNFGNDGLYKQSSRQSDGLCYMDSLGRWTAAPIMLTDWDNNTIVPTPISVVHDPLNPDWVYGTHKFYGILRQDLTNPSATLLFTRSTYQPNHAWHVTVTPPHPGYSSSCAFSPMQFDNSGRLWSHHYTALSDSDPDLRMEFWYWEPADRLAVNSRADYDTHPMKVLAIPGMQNAMMATLTVGKTDKNRNILVCATQNYGQPPVVADHGGTPDDPSDDRYFHTNAFVDENGDALRLARVQKIVEDPTDGAWIFCDDSGIFTAQAEDIFTAQAEGRKPQLTRLIVEFSTESGHSLRRLCEDGTLDICVDPEGRKWIATPYDGLYCLSADRRMVLAHFTPENSPLPSNKIINLAWDPKRRSLWLATEEGPMEFFPEGTSLPADASDALGPKVSITPNVVEPGYTGHVTIRGLQPNTAYTLESIPTHSEGSESETPETVLTLTSDETGRIQLHPAIQTLPAGQYRLSTPNSPTLLIL